MVSYKRNGMCVKYIYIYYIDTNRIGLYMKAAEGI